MCSSFGVRCVPENIRRVPLIPTPTSKNLLTMTSAKNSSASRAKAATVETIGLSRYFRNFSESLGEGKWREEKERKGKWREEWRIMAGRRKRQKRARTCTHGARWWRGDGDGDGDGARSEMGHRQRISTDDHHQQPTPWLRSCWQYPFCYSYPLPLFPSHSLHPLTHSYSYPELVPLLIVKHTLPQ